MPDKTMRIDIVSDVVCPWCIIGYKRLQQALAMLGDNVTADIHWHPFELNPMMAEGGQDLREHLAEKYGTSREDSDKARAKLTAIGADAGFDFEYYEGMRMYNSFKAHQLLYFARQHGLEHEMKLRLFAAHFSERKVIEDEDTLVAEAEAIGLDGAAARQALNEGIYADAVRKELKLWLSRGIQAVPTFVINEKFSIAGAHEPDALAGALRQIVLETPATA